MEGHDENKINEAEKSLYMRGGFRPNIKRASFSRAKEDAPKEWQEMPKPKKRFPILRLLFIVSALFFVGAVGVAVFLFSSGSNIVSPDNIEISVDGPVTLKGGEQMVMKVSIVNHNSVPLESANLQVTYPSGARSSEDISQDLKSYRHYLDTIAPGEVVNETLRAVLFGQENEKQDIHIALEYRTAGSNAIFQKEKVVSVTLTSSPIGVSIDLPDSVSAGQDVTAKVTLTSNSDKTLSGMYLLVTPPDGFLIAATDPQPQTGLLWQLGDLAPGTSRTFSIRGSIGGALNQNQGFKAVVGILDKVNGRSIAIPYGTALSAFQIQQPSVELAASLNGADNTVVATDPGQRIRADITWTNNLSVPVLNGSLTAKLSGPMLDQTRVSVENGFYDSQTNTITWKQQDIPELGRLESGNEAHTNFTFQLQDRDYVNTHGLTNPGLSITLSFNGQKTDEASTIAPVSASIERTIKVNSVVSLAAVESFTSGPFKNTGPMPPKVGQASTYTVGWQISSLSSGLRGARVSAILPTYVTWLGVKSPEGEDLSYNPLTGEVVWNAGSVAARSGYGNPPRSVYFQVSMTPSLSQQSSSPDLLGASQLTATDVFTNFADQAAADAVNTSSSDTGGQHSGDVQ